MNSNQDKEKYDKFVDQKKKYFSKKYIEELHLSESISKAIDTNLLQIFGHKNRLVVNAQTLKYNVNLEHTGTITTCFKIAYDSTSAIYAYLYSSSDKDVKHHFICCSPTYKSQDGEYRHRFIPWKQFLEICEKYSDIISQVEEFILPQMESRALELYTFFYYPFGFLGSEKQVEESINNLRLPIKLYILSWLYDFHQIHNKLIENHINPAYQFIIYQKAGIDVYEDIRSRVDLNSYYILMNHLSRIYNTIYDGEQALIRPECGQKIIPMSIREAIRVDDINFPTWREIYISALCSNLVLNLISPSFPFINNWFYIQNSNGTLYDNLPMHEKYNYSKIADDIAEQLRAADKYNYQNQNRRKDPLNTKFLRLSKLIDKSTSFADAYIRLTDLSICITSEYVGRTVRDLPILVANDPLNSGLGLIFTDYNIFNKHMFEFIYGFYSMNTKIGVLHGDLHINNATFFKLNLMVDEHNKPILVKDPRIIYFIKKKCYMFPHWGVYSSIIDFSRGIIGNQSIVENDFGQRFAEQYFKEQRTRVMRILYYNFPKFTEKYIQQLEALIIAKFSILFKIITVVDAISISGNILAMINIDELFKKKKIKLDEKIPTILSKINQRAESLALELLQKAVEGHFKSESDFEWPNLTLIELCFSDYLADSANLGKYEIVDVFNYNNDLKYSVEDYESYGPLLSNDEEIKLLSEYKLSDQNISEWMKFRNIDETNKLDLIISKYENKEPEIEISSWMLY